MLRFFFALLCGIVPFNTQSQTSDVNLVPDSWVHDVVHENGFVYMAGSSSSKCSPVPSISKVSLTTGQTVWNTTSTVDVTYQDARAFHKTGIVGDAVYAASSYSNLPSFSSELWKVDKNSGALLWKVNLDVQSIFTAVFFDYSSTQFLLICNSHYYYLINKSTGTIEFSLNNIHYTYLGMGPNNEIYVNYYEGMKKVINMNFGSPITVDNVPAGLHRVEHVNTSQVLLWREHPYQGKLLCLFDLATSQVLWEVPFNVSIHYSYGDLKVVNDYVYCSFRGGNPAANVVGKVQISTGSLVWRSINSYKSYSYTNPSYGNSEGSAVSIDVNSAGDVYLTGFANSREISGDMGIMKLDGATGTKVYERIITEEVTDFDRESDGVKAIVYQDRPYFIGNVIENLGTINHPVNRVVDHPGNLVTLVELSPTTGNIIKRHNYYGNRNVSSSTIQVARYLDQDLVVLQNRGRLMYLSRLNSQGSIVWETKVKGKSSFGHTAKKMVVDRLGNICIISQSTVLDNRRNSSLRPGAINWIFIVNSSGQLIQEIPATPLEQSDIYTDGDSFFVFGGYQCNTMVYKLNAQGLFKSKEVNLCLLETELETRMIAERSGNLLFISGRQGGLYVDKNTLDTQTTGLTLEFNVERINDVLIYRDTLYLAQWKDDVFPAYKVLTCHNLSNNSLIWSHVGSNHHSEVYYKKFLFGPDGYLYAIGKGNYNTFLIRKINRKTGVTVWTQQQWSPSQNLRARDLFFDSLRNELIVTGDLLIDNVRSYTSMAFSAATGVQTGYYKQTNINGTGLTIGQLGNSELITGGKYLASANDCTESSVEFRFYTTLLAPTHVSASDGLIGKVTVSWTPLGSSLYSRVYRSITNDISSALPITGWIGNSSFDDTTIEAGQHYFYFVRVSKDTNGTEPSPFSLSDGGYALLPAPSGVMASDGLVGKIAISWTPLGSSIYSKVFRNTTNDASAALPITGWIASSSFDDTSIEMGQYYFYFVRVSKDTNGSEPSPISLGDSGYAALPAPTGISASDGLTGRISIKWIPSSQSLFSKVYKSIGDIPASALPITAWLETSSYDDTDIIMGQRYFYFVQVAKDVVGTFSSSFSVGDDGYAEVVTSIDRDGEEPFALYPNPTTGILHIRASPSISDTFSIRLINSIGEIVYSDQLTVPWNGKQSLDIESHPSGYYLVIIQDKSGTYLTRKIFKR